MPYVRIMANQQKRVGFTVEKTQKPLRCGGVTRASQDPSLVKRGENIKVPVNIDGRIWSDPQSKDLTDIERSIDRAREKANALEAQLLELKKQREEEELNRLVTTRVDSELKKQAKPVESEVQPS